VVLYSINIFALLDSAEVSIPLYMYDNGGGQKILYFGVDPTATDSMDFELGEFDLPPAPPTGVFDTRWDTIIYRLKYQSATGADTIFFAWNFPSGITAKLEDLITGQFINVNMTGSGLYGLTEFSVFNQLKFTVYYNILSTDVITIIVPEDYTLFQNYPNPFNPNTKIQFQVPKTSNVNLIIYDMLGQEIKILLIGEVERGVHTVEWDGLNKSGINMSSGSYVYRLIAGEFVQTKKMILLK